MGGTQFGVPPKNISSLDYTGADLALVPVVEAQRDPTVNDKNYPIDCFWRNTTTRMLWWLSGFDSTGALWLLFTTGAAGPVLTLSDNSGTLVSPTVAGNIQLAAGAGITTTSTPASNLITIGLVGGANPIEKINVDANTPPGTNPVVPVTGAITITGGQVAATVVGTNVIRTDSLAANTFTIEIQRSTAVASTTLGDNGVSHFSSANFSVDANAFVTARGGSVAWQTISASQALVVNNGYICISPGGALVLTLPASPTIGDIIRVVLDGATSYQVVAAAGDIIVLGNSATSAGGSLTTTANGDTLEIVAQSAARWNVLSSVGNFVVA